MIARAHAASGGRASSASPALFQPVPASAASTSSSGVGASVAPLALVSWPLRGPARSTLRILTPIHADDRHAIDAQHEERLDVAVRLPDQVVVAVEVQLV